MKRQVTAVFLATLLVLSTALTGCDWAKTDRRVAVAGFTLHLTTETAALTAQAFKNRNRLSENDYKTLLNGDGTGRFVGLAGLTEAAQQVNLEFDKLAEIGPQTATGALDAVRNFIAVADSLLANQLVVRLDAQTLGQIRTQLAAAVLVASGIQTALITLQKPLPVDKLTVDKATAQRAFQTGSRGFTADDAILAADILNIGARFISQLNLVRGADAAFVKSQRDAKYEALKRFYAEQARM